MQNKKSLIFSTIILIVAVSAIILGLTTKIVYIKACTDSSYPIFDFEKSFGVVDYIKEDIFFNNNLDYIFYSAGGPLWLVVGSITANILPLISTAILCVATIVEIVYAFTKRTLAHKNSFIKPLAIFTGILYLLMCIFCFVGYTINNSMANGYMEFYVEIGFYINCIIGLALIILPCFLGDKEKEPNVNKAKNIVLYTLTSVLCVVFAVLLLSTQYTELLPEKTIFSLTTYAVTNFPWSELPAAADIPFGLSQYAMFATFIALAFVLVYSIIALIMTIANKKTNWLSIRIKRWSIAVMFATFVLYFLVICSLCAYLSNIVWDFDGVLQYALTLTSLICFSLPFVINLIARLIPAQKQQKSDSIA